LIRWMGRPQTRYLLEMSTGFSRWTPIHTRITEYEPGQYEAVLGRPPQEHGFFRVREAPPHRTEPQRP
jgi:hypothetical protein